jgi:glycosyltransferase involved in cell wall biosynthesis
VGDTVAGVSSPETLALHTVSVVIPVYRGEATLTGVVEEVAALFEQTASPDGHRLVVSEVLLVHDNGPDASDKVIRQLSERFTQVRGLWLSRNFGQHAATLAGMASSGSDWIVTMDEDGQHDPAAIPAFLDVAMRERAAVVYAEPTNEPPHGFMRNTASRASKRLVTALAPGTPVGDFQSYRLILGEIGRSVAAYAGAGVYLDIAMSWVTARTATCPVHLRAEGDRPSGYSPRTLMSHFRRLVLSSGTRGLRLVSLMGVSFACVGVLVAIYAFVGTLLGGTDERGWASIMVVLCLGIGALLFSLGVIAEYIGVAVNMAMGRPLYYVVSDPANGPWARTRASSPPHGG